MGVSSDRYFPWTPELRQKVITMWMAGFSATQIGMHLSMIVGLDRKLERCAVMGVIRRAGVYRSCPGPVPRRPRIKTPTLKRRFEGKWA